MPTLRRPPLGLAGSLLLVGACAAVPAKDTRAPRSARSSGPAATGLEIPDPFPTDAQIEQIAAQPTPEAAELLGDSVAPVDAWTVGDTAAQTTAVVTYTGPDPSAQAMAAVLGEAPQGRRVTRGMQCVAHEVSEFVLAHGDEPAADIRGFIAARCGTPVVWPVIVSHRLPIEEIPRRPLHPAKDRQLFDSLAQAIAPGASAGLSLSRGEDEGVLTLAWGVPDVDLEPLPMSTEHRSVDLRGRMAWDFGNLSGYATRGALGSLPCRPIPREHVTAPRFALRCPVSRDDPMTVIELHASAPDRLLGRRVLRVMVSPDAAAPTHYQAPQLSLPIGPEQHDDLALATALNTLRRQAELPPVRSASGQSEVLGDLLPHFLAATASAEEGEQADQIALGMMAGRKIEGEVAWGSFFSTGAPSNWSLSRHLAAELLSPYSRSRMFDPAATTVAYASLSDPSHAMRRSIIATYGELADRDFTVEMTALFDAVDRQRVAAGLEPVVRVQGPGDMRTMTAAAHRVRDGQQTPNEALDGLLEHFVQQTQRSFRGLILAPHSLEGWEPELSGELVQAPRVAMAITISHYRPPGAAWGRHLVLVAFTTL